MVRELILFFMSLTNEENCMCDALDMYDSYRIAHLVHELGALHDVLKRAKTMDEKKRIIADRQRISAQLIHTVGWIGLGRKIKNCAY